MKFVIILVVSTASLVCCIPPPHPAVVAARQEEELLPAHLRSTALHNPNLQEILPLTSLLHKGEMPVFQREADAVSRREIYNILTHAGLVQRIPGLPLPTYHRPRQHKSSASHQRISSPQHFDVPFLSNADLLQYL